MCPTTPVLQPVMAEWPSPAGLEGVKSRKRLILDVKKSYFKSIESQNVNTFSGLKLSLESRIAAVGKNGSASIGLLLGERTLVKGEVTRHDSLEVAHLGPHLMDTSDPSIEECFAAISSAMQHEPQVVILDEGASAGIKAWNQTFSSILDSDVLQAFRGAVVICVAEETPAVKKICSQRWIGAHEWLWQEEVTDDEGLEFLDDVLNMPEGIMDEEFMHELSRLAWKDPFNEDVFEKAEEKDWTVAVLTRPYSGAPADNAPTRELAGFICYKIRPGRVFHIARIAVPERMRIGGYGRRIMRWVLDKAAAYPKSEVAWIELSAVVQAVPFYESFGFMDMSCDDVEAEDHYCTWMEMPNISNVEEPDEL